jgi:hypothetical protein
MQCPKAYVGRLRPNFISMCKPNWKKVFVVLFLKLKMFEFCRLASIVRSMRNMRVLGRCDLLGAHMFADDSESDDDERTGIYSIFVQEPPEVRYDDDDDGANVQVRSLSRFCLKSFDLLQRDEQTDAECAEIEQEPTDEHNAPVHAAEPITPVRENTPPTTCGDGEQQHKLTNKSPRSMVPSDQ